MNYKHSFYLLSFHFVKEVFLGERHILLVLLRMLWLQIIPVKSVCSMFLTSVNKFLEEIGKQFLSKTTLSNSYFQLGLFAVDFVDQIS